jgi:hypothetical protein
MRSGCGRTLRAVPALGLRRMQQAALRRLASPASQMAFRVGLAVQIEIRAAGTSQKPTSACSHLIFTAYCGRSFRGRYCPTPFASSHVGPNPKSHFVMPRTLGKMSGRSFPAWRFARAPQDEITLPYSSSPGAPRKASFPSGLPERGTLWNLSLLASLRCAIDSSGKVLAFSNLNPLCGRFLRSLRDRTRPLRPTIRNQLRVALRRRSGLRPNEF